MADAALKEATYADLEAVPPYLIAEIIDGGLVTHRMRPVDSIALMSLAATLNDFARKAGWAILQKTELRFDRNFIVPDLAGWRRTRLPALPKTNWIETPPDWACEILSPETEAWDRGAKCRIYGECGVSFLWFLNSTKRQLEAFQRVGANWILTGVAAGVEEARLPPFEAAPFSLGLLWPFDEPNDAGASPQS